MQNARKLNTIRGRKSNSLSLRFFKCGIFQAAFYVMQFIKGTSSNRGESDEDVKYIPSIKVESKLDADELRLEYGIGYKLLVKQGFKPGRGIGLRKNGISEPIRASIRKDKGSLNYKDFEEPAQESKKRVAPSSLTVDEIPDALEIVVN